MRIYLLIPEVAPFLSSIFSLHVSSIVTLTHNSYHSLPLLLAGLNDRKIYDVSLREEKWNGNVNRERETG